MTDKVSQEERTLKIATALEDVELLMLSMYGSDSLGRMFQYELELMTDGSLVEYKDILGTNVTISLNLDEDEPRYLNGYISKFALTGTATSRTGTPVYYYRATMVPGMWFLTRCADCRIFQNLTIPDIIQKVYKDRVHLEVTPKLHGTYTKWDYCVQYRETEFDFISRLMEYEGIYYYFEHLNGSHTLILCDSQTSHDKIAKFEDIKFDKPDFETHTEHSLWNWLMGREITPTQYAMLDYDPLQPQAQLFKVVNVDHEHDPQPYEIFDYPGGYADPEDGRNYVDARLKELTGAYAVAHATSNARGLIAGCKFSLIDHPTDNDEYLITTMSYRIKNDDLGLVLGTSGEAGSYLCQFTCIPKAQEYRSPQTTPRPVVQGPQTAVVVGPAGEEIYVDKYGRVKVQFFWDREGKKNESSSCWIRVSQPWAGKSWGAISIPRIGQEVIVEFLEGDPDLPIITGRVYNGENMPPYELPAQKTKTTFKTNSSKGGGGFNELRFEDNKGNEQIFMWAQKNMDVNVQNDRFETIKHDTHLTVTNNQYLNVKNEVHTKVSSHTFQEVGGDVSVKISGKEAKEVAGSKSLKVAGNVIEEFGANHSSIVSSQLFLKATDVIIEGTGSVTIKVGGSSIAMNSSGISIKTSGDIELQAGGKIKETAGGDMTISAGGQYSMSASAAMSLSASGSGSVSANGPMEVKTSAVMVIKGSMVNIN